MPFKLPVIETEIEEPKTLRKALEPEIDLEERIEVEPDHFIQIDKLHERVCKRPPSAYTNRSKLKRPGTAGSFSKPFTTHAWSNSFHPTLIIHEESKSQL
jgi:hypothetical protein